MAFILDSLFARLSISEPVKHSRPYQSRSYPSDPVMHEQKEFAKRPSMVAEIASRRVSRKELLNKIATYPDLHESIQKCRLCFEVLANSSEHLSEFLTTLVKYSSFSEEFVHEVLSGFSNPCYDTPIHIHLINTQAGFITKLLAILKTFPHLETLDIERSKILDHGLTSVLNVAHALVTLKLKECPKLTESSFESISQLPRIQTLKVQATTAFTDAALRKIVASCKTLLNLTCTKCTSLTFSNLYRQQRLQKLAIGECSLTRLSLMAISEVFTSLQTFKLRDCPSLKEDDFSELHLGCHVTKLELSSLSISEERLMQVLDEVDTIATLTWLSVSNLALTDCGFQMITLRSRKLMFLDVSYCEGLTQKSFTGFPQTLRTFDASNTQIDRKGAKGLLLFCPQLATVRLGLCEQLPYAALKAPVTKDRLKNILAENKMQGPAVGFPEEDLQFSIDM